MKIKRSSSSFFFYFFSLVSLLFSFVFTLFFSLLFNDQRIFHSPYNFEENQHRDKYNQLLRWCRVDFSFECIANHPPSIQHLKGKRTGFFFFFEEEIITPNKEISEERRRVFLFHPKKEKLWKGFFPTKESSFQLFPF